MSATDPPELILAGFGASSSLQMTLEAQQMAARIGHVLALGLPTRLRALLKRQGIEVTDLDSSFDDRPFAEAYAAVAATVLARAEAAPPAMFVSQSNPLLLNAINRYLLVEAKKRGVAIRVYAGVSAMDVVISELGVDVGRVGLQTISARGLAERPAALNPNVPLLVLQIAGLVAEGESVEGYGRLVEVLRRAYEDSQPITLVNMPGDGRVPRATVTLARFSELISHIDPSSCLFVDTRRKAVSS